MRGVSQVDRIMPESRPSSGALQILEGQVGIRFIKGQVARIRDVLIASQSKRRPLVMRSHEGRDHATDPEGTGWGSRLGHQLVLGA